MRIRHWQTQADGGDVVLGDLWVDEHGVVVSDPPKLRDSLASIFVDMWPEHRDEIVRITDGDRWLRGMLWMSRVGRLGGGIFWFTVVEDGPPAEGQLICRGCGLRFDVSRSERQGQLPGMEDPAPEICPSCAWEKTNRNNVTVTSPRRSSAALASGEQAVPKKLREVVWRGRPLTVDEDGLVQPAAGIDMAAYDAELEAAGFEFVDGDEDETELTFLDGPDATGQPARP